MYKVFCDLCGKEITYTADEREYKIKRRWHSGFDNGWEKLNVHTECVKRLYEEIHKNEIDKARNKNENYR